MTNSTKFTMVIISVLLLLSLFGRFCCVIEFRITCAKIEQCREDVQNTHQNLFVIGQATKFNQQVQVNRTYNDQWFFDLLLPDDWNNVKLITFK